MEGLYLFVILVVGLLAGAGAVWLLLQGRTMTAYDRARAEVESERAELAERLRGKEEQIQALQASLEESTVGFRQLHLELEAIAEKRAMTESERAELTAELRGKDEHLQALKASLEQSTAAFGQLRQELDAIADKRALAESERSRLTAGLQDKEEQIQTLKASFGQSAAGFSQLRRDLDVLSQKLPSGESPGPPPDQAPRPEAIDAIARTIEGKITRLQQQLDQMEATRLRSAASSEALRGLGATVYERVGVLSQDVTGLRHTLAHALDLCNLLAGSLETRVLVPARELKEFGTNGNQQPSAEQNQLALLTPDS